MTTTPTIHTVDIRRYDDGRYLGIAEIDATDMALYLAGVHPAFQWPEGITVIANVRRVCDSVELDRDVGDGVAVYLE